MIFQKKLPNQQIISDVQQIEINDLENDLYMIQVSKNGETLKMQKLEVRM